MDKTVDQQIYVRFPEEADAAALTDIYRRNRAFFEKYSPNAIDEFYTEEYQLQLIVNSKSDRETDRRYDFVICRREDGSVIGSVGLSFVVRGALQSCMIGYSLDQDYNGRGYMTDAVSIVVQYAFEELKFHRITGEASLRIPVQSVSWRRLASTRKASLSVMLGLTACGRTIRCWRYSILQIRSEPDFLRQLMVQYLCLL